MPTISELQNISTQVRRDIIRMVHAVNSGHPGGSLGAADFMTALYFVVMKHNPNNFTMDGIGEDLFFLSNGHVSPLFYSVLAHAGYFPVKELATFRKLNTRLQGHPTTHDKLPGVRIASGSLGQGLSVAIGAAISKKLNNDTHIVYSLHGDGELQEGRFGIADKIGGEPFVAQHQLFKSQFARHPAQSDGMEQGFRLGRQFAKAVGHPLPELQQVFLGFNRVKFLVQIQPFGDVGDVIIGDQDLQVGFDDAFTHIGFRRVGRQLFGEIVLPEFKQRLIQDLLVHFEPDFRDKTALLGTQDVARPPDIEIAHGNIESAPQVGELLDGPQSFTRLISKRRHGRGQQVTEGLFVGSPYPAPELVQVAQPVMVCIVDDDGVDI